MQCSLWSVSKENVCTVIEKVTTLCRYASCLLREEEGSEVSEKCKKVEDHVHALPAGPMLRPTRCHHDDPHPEALQPCKYICRRFLQTENLLFIISFDTLAVGSIIFCRLLYSILHPKRFSTV